MAKSELVTLGGQEYEVGARPLRFSREWREKLNGPFAEIISLLKNAGGIQLNNAGDIAGIIELISSKLIHSPEVVYELLMDYAPTLKADEERILDTATDEEVLGAFQQVLKLVYPFGGILKQLQKMSG